MDPWNVFQIRPQPHHQFPPACSGRSSCSCSPSKFRPLAQDARLNYVFGNMCRLHETHEHLQLHRCLHFSLSLFDPVMLPALRKTSERISAATSNHALSPVHARQARTSNSQPHLQPRSSTRNCRFQSGGARWASGFKVLTC